jgi:hypothetical protein
MLKMEHLQQQQQQLQQQMQQTPADDTAAKWLQGLQELAKQKAAQSSNNIMLSWRLMAVLPYLGWCMTAMTFMPRSALCFSAPTTSAATAASSPLVDWLMHRRQGFALSPNCPLTLNALAKLKALAQLTWAGA